MEEFINGYPICIFCGMLFELFLWKWNRCNMAKKSDYDCERCEDWSCQKKWCIEKSLKKGSKDSYEKY